MLTSEHLLLRPFHPDDAAALFAYRTNPRVSAFQSWCPASQDEAADFIGRMQGMVIDTPGTWFQLALVDRETGSLAGDAGLHFSDQQPETVEVGISLAPEQQGKGLATEALTAIFDFLFLKLDKHRVFASTDALNLASIALLERLGMRREAHHLESFHTPEGWCDDVIYALLAREWRSRP